MVDDPFSLDDMSVAVQAAAGDIPFDDAPPYLDGLNAPQKEAVLTTDGAVLVLAGAGTGKTRALTTRIAHILKTGLAAPWQILAVTFTNKAAREMQERIAASLGQPVEGMWIGTFHAVCVRMLRRHGDLVGLASNFTILDTDDQIRLLKQLIDLEGLDSKRWPARQMAGLIDRWKNRALTPDKVPSEEAYSFGNGKGIALYTAYQERLKTLNACDFGDLLLHTISIFQKYPDVLADYHRLFQFILVDEYQDTNVAQYLWLRLLAQARKNICCVGDDDQSIYGWRGAEVGNILRFEKDFPGASVIRLEQNYRSTGHILGAASGLIAGNQDRLGKTLWTAAEEGESVRVRGVWDATEEARSICEEIEAWQTKGERLSEMAILVRAGFQTREFEERLITLGLPYRIYGGTRFYERQEIRDAIAYLRLIVSPSDDLAFERIINVPKRGMGDKAVQRIHTLARDQGVSMMVAARQLCESADYPARSRSMLTKFVTMIENWRRDLDTLDHTDLIRAVLDDSGYTDMWKADKSAQAPGRLDNLKELVSAAGEFDTLPGMLEHIQLVMDNDSASTTEQVTVMTLHAAKGLEFDTVFLAGWEEGVFPNQRALDETGLKGLEEERRLGYVGITRARKRAYIFFAANRQVFGQWQSSIPSRFIEELPEKHIEVMTASGLYSGRRERSTSYQRDDVEDLGDGYYTPSGDKYGPGWGRRQSRANDRDPPTLDMSRIKKRAPKKKPEWSSEATHNFGLGERVFHDKFGYGTIEEIDGSFVRIAFDKAGNKRLVDRFLTPADDA